MTIRTGAAGDRRRILPRDRGRCAVGAAPGRAFQVRVWYRGAGPRLFLWHRTTQGSWKQWAISPRFPSTRRWTRAVWETPALPAGVTDVSPGVSIASVGSVRVDDLSLR
jgi:hypothetical protein